MAGGSAGKITVLHGPNLDRLGAREPEIYGTETLEIVNREIRSLAESLGYTVEIRQTNQEAEMIEHLLRADGDSVGIVLNAGAWTHTSLALREAVRGLRVPAIEVHLSNVYAREPFRRTSVIEDLVAGKILGFGKESYLLALRAIDALHRRKTKRP
ncbi:MAG: 3-dehydroquinate dehydratase [Candidatus Eisenbacteria bacterium]|nr:3-dehydroquinate dehydratase [Candidatus Eisenbacteria bacterium]